MKITVLSWREPTALRQERLEQIVTEFSNLSDAAIFVAEQAAQNLPSILSVTLTDARRNDNGKERTHSYNRRTR